ncbi:ATP-binding protein [Amycolatopsis sp. OK19-0408]|uniref:ATP-binding protein n=1 Tax=Amycolatopsis iheyensis TaxID=2945988 RepID=A0A9X2N663_9PSEU|nr:ATP-binding protein [Amycolatopsis iheyensis]MCR6481992.1 ATP-binding protein [Amycolatopsis iheyensis]
MAEGVELRLRSRTSSALVTVTGELDLAGCPLLRDGLLKIGADTPPGVIADIDGLALDVRSPSLFPFVAQRLEEWPGIPMAVVTRCPAHLALFERYGLDRFVPVHPDVETAERALPRRIRRRAGRALARGEAGIAQARAFVSDRTREWGVPSLEYDGTLIAAELTDNASRHTTSEPRLRLDLRQDLLTIAVSDDDPRPAVLIERADILEPGLGLRIVAQTARAWGSSGRWTGGKVVWAVLALPERRRGRAIGP